MSSSTQPPPGAVQPLRGGALVIAALLLASANFVAVLDMTIANVSLASIAGSLGISSSQGTWVITSYSVAEAIVVPLTGWLAARFGPVRVFSTAMVLFGLFSAVCGFSHSLGVLVFGRIMQGLTGGLLIPLSQTLLLKIFPKEKAAAAMGLWAMTTLVAPVVGPILGGWICDNWAWPLIFFINLPIVAFCAPAAARLLRRYEETPKKAPIDKVGLALLIVFVGALQIMVDTGKEKDWFSSPEIVALAIISAIGFVAFVIWELTEKHPIVDLRIFRHRGFSAGVLTLSLAFGAVFGANVLTPLWLQTNMGYTSTWAGMATAWGAVLAVAAAPMAGMLVAKVDPRILVFFGLCWIGTVMGFRTGATSGMTYWQISIPLLMMGLGMPFFFVPLTALCLGNVEPHETASASGLQNFLRTLSGAVATSVVNTVWENKASYQRAEFSGLIDPHGQAMAAMTHKGMSVLQAKANLAHMVENQAVTVATNQVMLVVTLIFFASAFVIWLAPKPARQVSMAEAGH